MRKGGKILQEVFDIIQKYAKEGVSLDELDRIAEDYIRTKGAEPSFKGYKGFPASICAMLNSEVVHGIPDGRKLKNGDLLTVDCGVFFNKLHTDAAISLVIGGDQQNKERAKFSSCVKEALEKACKVAKPKTHIGDIGNIIEEQVIKNGYSICKEYTGHGIGYSLHEDPFIFNYGKKGTGELLKEGMTICIEPIVASGNPKVKTLQDGWTVVTRDGRDAVQWEHCGVVTSQGLEIFA